MIGSDLFKSNIYYSVTVSASNATIAMLTWDRKITKAIQLYPNKRIVHLAFYARKKRTRKKNLNRILSYISK